MRKHLLSDGKGMLLRLPTKMQLAVKLTFLFFLAASLQLNAKSSSLKVSLSVTNQSLEKVFKEIETQTGYVFWYKVDMVKQAKKVTVKVFDVDLKRALDEVFKEQPFSYSIVEKNIVVRDKKPAEMNPRVIHASTTSYLPCG